MFKNSSFVILFLVILIIMVAIAAKYKQHDSSIPKGPCTITNFPTIRKNTNKQVEIPLIWDSFEGAYMIRVRVGNNIIESVLDTGCGHVTAKTNDCQWKQCPSCSTQKCPIHGGGYYESKSKGGMSEQMTYGSQVDTVIRDNDSVHVIANGSEIPMGDENNFEILKVTAITGTSYSNLLGFSNILQRPKRLKNVHPLIGLNADVWTMRVGNKRSSIYLGKMNNVKFTRMSFVYPSSMSYKTNFYMVPVTSITVDNKQIVAPKYMLLDTGTTHTYLPPSTIRSLKQNGWDFRSKPITFTFGNKSITYRYNDLRDPDYSHQSVLVTDLRDPTAESVSNMFGKQSCMLFGVLMMRGRHWEFDLKNQTLGIS